jgi:Cytotoxic
MVNGQPTLVYAPKNGMRFASSVGSSTIAGLGIGLAGITLGGALAVIGGGAAAVGVGAAVVAAAPWVALGIIGVAIGQITYDFFAHAAEKLKDGTYSKGGKPALPGDPYNPDIVGNRIPSPQYPDGIRGPTPQPGTDGNYKPAPKDYVQNGLPGIPGTQYEPGAGRRTWTDEQGNIYEWDSQHGTVEKYSPNGTHLGEFDPKTGEQTKPKDPTRSPQR